jgi:hypothetical protein
MSESIYINHELMNKEWQKVTYHMNEILDRVVVTFDQLPKELSPDTQDEVFRSLKYIRSELAGFDNACNIITSFCSKLA